MRGPSPLASAPSPEEMDGQRSLWCPAYEACLDLAFRNRWQSFTCATCSEFPRARPFRKREANRAFDMRRRDMPPDVGPSPALP